MMKEKTEESTTETLKAGLLNCNEECPKGYIKVEVYDPDTGELLGCRCISEP